MKTAARCECYNGHNSSIGRCNVRDVEDADAKDNDSVLCERCKTECLPKVRVILAFMKRSE